MNLSSEANDGPSFTGVSFATWDPWGPFLNPNNPPPDWFSNGCIEVCVSAISQADADLCAQLQAFLCGHVSPIYNEEQSCSVPCPDGQMFTATIPGGTYAAESLFVANEIAHAAACAKAQATLNCPSPPPPPPPAQFCVIVSDSPLPDAPLGVPYSFGLSFAGTITDPLFWMVNSGTLPDGLTLDTTTGIISGTPTTGGISTFSIIFSNGITTCQKNFQLTVNDTTCFTNDPTLPGGTVNSSYTDTLITAFPVDPGMQFVYVVTAGTFPPGLSLNGDTGEITGTPSSPGTFCFTVTLTEIVPGGGS